MAAKAKGRDEGNGKPPGMPLGELLAMLKEYGVEHYEGGGLLVHFHDSVFGEKPPAPTPEPEEDADMESFEDS